MDANLTEINDRIHLPTEKQCYSQLLNIQDRTINKLVIAVIADSQKEEFTPLLVRATTKKDPIVAAAASEAYLNLRHIKNTA